MTHEEKLKAIHGAWTSLDSEYYYDERDGYVCFFCWQKIGKKHLDDCAFVKINEILSESE